jgi:hypothetical protein
LSDFDRLYFRRIATFDGSSPMRVRRSPIFDGLRVGFCAIWPAPFACWRFPVAAPIRWTNAVTLGSVAVLVGTELVGAGGAAGWAIGGLFQIGETLTHVLEGLLILLALTGLYYFLRAALAHEPIRG